MLRQLSKALPLGGALSANASQAQQWRLLNVHEYQASVWEGNRVLWSGIAGLRAHKFLVSAWAQGAQLMAKFGVNVPEGLPAFSVKEVEEAAAKLADSQGEVSQCMAWRCMGRCRAHQRR